MIFYFRILSFSIYLSLAALLWSLHIRIKWQTEQNVSQMQLYNPNSTRFVNISNNIIRWIFNSNPVVPHWTISKFKELCRCFSFAFVSWSSFSNWSKLERNSHSVNKWSLFVRIARLALVVHLIFAITDALTH